MHRRQLGADADDVQSDDGHGPRAKHQLDAGTTGS
jgi:hypothetical protein